MLRTPPAFGSVFFAHPLIPVHFFVRPGRVPVQPSRSYPHGKQPYPLILRHPADRLACRLQIDIPSFMTILYQYPGVSPTEKPPVFTGGLSMGSGGDLLFRAVTSQVPSALKGLTSVFGMGTGGTPSSLPPEMVSIFESPFILTTGSSLPTILRPFVGTIGPFRLPFLPLPGPSGCLTHPDNCTAFDSVL